MGMVLGCGAMDDATQGQMELAIVETSWLGRHIVVRLISSW